MSNTRTSTVERNGNSNKGTKLVSPWTRAITSNSEWNDKVRTVLTRLHTNRNADFQRFV